MLIISLQRLIGVPIDAAEFDAHMDLPTIISRFLCRNNDKGFSAKEISQATGVSEAEVVNTMLKLAFLDLTSTITGRKKKTRIEDVTIAGTTFYRCIPD